MLYSPSRERQLTAASDTGYGLGIVRPPVAALEALVSALPSPVAVLDRHGEIVAVSDAWRRFQTTSPGATDVLCGPGENYLRTSCQAAGPFAAHAHQVAVGIQAVLNGELTRFTHEYGSAPPDQQRWVLLQASPLDEGLSGAVVQLTDITTQRDAAEATHHLETFVAMASHECRTPLAVIKSFLTGAERQLASCARESAAPEIDAQLLTEVQHAVSSAQQAATQLSGLLDVLLQVARARTCTLVMRPRQCDLAALVRQIVAGHQLLQPERPLRVHTQRARPLVIDADPVWLAQVLTNLLDNACKYSPEGSPVDVTLKLADDAVTVSIRDHGPGVPKSEQARIWECFYRAAEPQHERRASAGLGLGLYVTRLVVEQHRGQVGVRSSSRSGATFWFTLPRVAVAPGELPLEGAAVSTSARPATVSETVRTSRRMRATALPTVH